MLVSRIGMQINVEKTEIQYLGRGSRNFQVQINGQQLEQMENFVYLGGKISSNGGSESDVTRRIDLVRGIFQNLNQIWTSKELSRPTKMQVYETLVLSALLYNADTWTLKEVHKNRLRVLEMTFLRKIEGVTCWDRIRNKEICARLSLRRTVIQWIQQRRLRYFGHVSRMCQNRFPRIAMEGYVHGERGRGRPKKRWMDQVRQDCEDLGLCSIQDATWAAQDRRCWRILMDELPIRAQASPWQ